MFSSYGNIIDNLTKLFEFQPPLATALKIGGREKVEKRVSRGASTEEIPCYSECLISHRRETQIYFVYTVLSECWNLF